MPRRPTPLWPNRSIKPPYGVVEIDWTHPLACGLVWCVVCGNSPIPVDLVSGSSEGVLSGSPSLMGGCAYVDNYRTSNVLIGSESATALRKPPLPLTMTARFRRSATGRVGVATDYDTRYCGVSLMALNGSTSYEFLIGDAGDAGFNTANRYSTVFGTVGNTPISASASAVSSAGIECYQNGILQSHSHGGTASSLVYTNTRASLFTPAGPLGTNAAAVHLWYVYMHNRVLTASEHRKLADDPYCFLRPVIRRSYGFVAAAPAGGLSIPVAMHHYLHTLGR